MLVSNTGESRTSSSSSAFLAQRFQTGTNAAGYTIAEVDIYLSTFSTKTTSVNIRQNNSSNRPGDLVATLTNPATFTDNSLNTFTAPSDTTIEGSTPYWITVNDGATNRASYGSTTANGETGQTAWTIDNSRYWRTNESSNWSSETVKLVIAVKGTARTSTASDDATLSDLELEDDSGTDITLTPIVRLGHHDLHG